MEMGVGMGSQMGLLGQRGGGGGGGGGVPRTARVGTRNHVATGAGAGAGAGGTGHHQLLFRTRRAFNGAGFCGCAACLCLAARAASPAASIASLVLAQAVSMLAIGGGFEVNKLDVATSPRAVSLLQGVSQTLGNLSGVCVVPFAAYVAKRYGWDAVFVAVAAQLLCAGAVFHRFGGAAGKFA
jgi:hypothetical protein